MRVVISLNVALALSLIGVAVGADPRYETVAVGSDGRTLRGDTPLESVSPDDRWVVFTQQSSAGGAGVQTRLWLRDLARKRSYLVFDRARAPEGTDAYGATVARGGSVYYQETYFRNGVVDGGAVVLWRPPSRRVRQVLRLDEFLGKGQLQISETGRHLTLAANPRQTPGCIPVARLDLRTGRIACVRGRVPRNFDAATELELKATEDGTFAFFATTADVLGSGSRGRKRLLYRHDWRSGRTNLVATKAQLARAGGSVGDFTPSRNGARVAFIINRGGEFAEGRVFIRDLAASALTLIDPDPDEGAGCYWQGGYTRALVPKRIMTSDGRVLAVSCPKGAGDRLAVRLIDEDRVLFRLAHEDVSNAVISPRGTWVAVYRSGETLRRVVLPRR